MLRKRVLAAATASILALGMSMGGAGAALANSGQGGGGGNSSTSVPVNEKKVYVCKYVGTPGVDERLQTGNNPIEVSVNAIQNNTWDGVVPGYFSDAQNRSYVLQYSEARGDGQRDEPTIDDCPDPQGPPVEEPPVEEPPALECITAVWSMPAWINSTTPSFDPYQTLVASYETECYNLNVLIPADCGTQFQIDSYVDNDITAALLAGGKLYGPNDPRESFPPNHTGWNPPNAAWKLVKNEPCAEPDPVVMNITFMCKTAVDGPILNTEYAGDVTEWDADSYIVRIRSNEAGVAFQVKAGAALVHEGVSIDGDLFFALDEATNGMTVFWEGGKKGTASTNESLCSYPEEEPVPNFLETSHEQYCGGVDITLRNVSPWIYPVTVEINGMASFGPVVDNRTDGGLSGPQKDQSATRSITFDEDSGDQSVRYRVAAGSESDLYSGLPVGEWTELTILTDCEPNEEPPVEEPPVDVDPDVQFPTSPLVEPGVSVVMPTCESVDGSFTLSATEGVTWFVNGTEQAAGTYEAAAGSTVTIDAAANEGFGFGVEQQTEWSFTFTAADCPITEQPEELVELETLALTGVTGLAGTAALVALLITLTGVGMVAARRRVEV